MDLVKKVNEYFNEGPPNLDDMLKKWMSSKNSSGGSASVSSNDKKTGGVFLAALVAVWFFTGFFVVKPAEEATVLTFGKYSDTYTQGIHWAPSLISKVFIVDTQNIMTLTHSSEMLTADENIVDVSVSVWYRIADPKKYLFAVAQPNLSIKEATASALRQVIGGTSLDQVLTTGRDKVMEDTKANLINILQPYNTGIEIREVNLLPAKPPEQVTAAFDDAIKAREDEQKYINQAKAYAEKVQPKAEGLAARVIRQAEADAQKLVLEAKEKTAPYNALVAAYKSQPNLTTTRLYYGMLGGVLQKVHKIIAEDPSSLRMILTSVSPKELTKVNLAAANEDYINDDVHAKDKVISGLDNKRLDYSMVGQFTAKPGEEVYVK